MNSNREENEPNVTHKFMYVFVIGIGLATAIVIFVIFLLKRRLYNNKRNKRGRLQADLKAPAEASSNDFQELGRADVSAMENNSPSARRIHLICKDIESTTS